MHERKHVRFAVQRPVTFHGDTLSGKGTILNISREGCASETIASPESYLQLTMQSAGIGRPIVVDLRLLNCHSSDLIEGGQLGKHLQDSILSERDHAFLLGKAEHLCRFCRG